MYYRPNKDYDIESQVVLEALDKELTGRKGWTTLNSKEGYIYDSSFVRSGEIRLRVWLGNELKENPPDIIIVNDLTYSFYSYEEYSNSNTRPRGNGYYKLI